MPMKAVFALMACLALVSTSYANLPQEQVSGVLYMMKSLPGLIDPAGAFRWDPYHPENACSFNGITCSDVNYPQASQTISKLSLDGFLGGSLPEQIGLFRDLTSILLWNPQITGPLPQSMGNLTQLQSLSITSARMSGPVPDIMAMPQLKKLTIVQVGLQGTLPDQWSSHPSIQDIILRDNVLEGTVPASWAFSSSLRGLDLTNNHLSGTIPSLPNILTLSLAQNRLTGGLPMSNPASNAAHVDFGSNFLTGTIPSWTLPNSMVFLNLRNNSLSGTIPDIFTPGLWRAIELSYNQLTGTVPPSISNLKLIYTLGLSNNQLTLCPAPTTFPSSAGCTIGPQATLPPCSCVQVYKNAGCLCPCI